MDLIILNKVNFIKWLREDLLILQHVQSRKLVTMDEYTKLKNIRDSSERINELLDTILSKGNLFCLNFLNLLKEDGVNASSPQLKEWISTINNSAVRSQEEPPAKDEEPPAAESETEEAEDQEPGEEIVNKVLSAQHQIQKHRIRVFPYYESLGTALCGKDRPTLRLPETFTKNIDKSVWKYLQDNPGSLDLIKREMRKHFCQLDFRDAAVKISPLASLLNQGLQSGKLVETWRENASAEFTATMSKYKSLEIFVQRDAWSETEAEIHKTLFAKPVTMVFQKDQGTVMLAGLAEDVSRTGDVIQITIDRITHRIQREKGSVTDEITMVPSIYELVMLDGLEQEISNSFPEMELSYHSHSKKLALYGLKQEVLESKNKILQEVIGLKRRMVELHPSILEFLTRRDQEELKWDLLLSKGIRASLEIKENRALLVAKTEKTLKDSEERLKAVLNHKCLDVEDPGVLRKAEWQDLIICLNNLFNSPVMTVVIITSGSQIMVAGFDDVVELVLEQLSDFVHNNSNLVATIEADRTVVRFIQEHKKQDWLAKDFGDEFHNRINIQSATPGPTMQQQIKEKDDQQQKGGGFVIKGKVVNPACFSICGPSKAAVDQTKQWIEKLISDKHVFEIISDPVIFSLSNKDQQQILELQQSLDVSVRVEHKVQGEDQEEATILVEGLSRDVLKAVSEIQTILKKARDEVGLKKNMKVISELVDWQYLQSGQYQSFNQLTNLHLEQALAKKSLHVDISLHGQAYKVTMPEGPALSAEGGNQISIRRIDKIQVVASDSLPQEWDPMTATELFKECPLQDNGHEYNDVLSHFGKTCPNNNILKISRIQNPGMWRKYQHNKHIMEIKNGHKNNEKRLFHGTRAVSMKHINHSGFNRSYAGMNAAAYGRGTYFALNASYSAINTYSVPNQQGHKHMYLCRVLTGDYTPGNASVIVPPLKSANGTDLFDSTVDNVSAPTIFVVFRDDHAYPEYLITFT
ncbi:protein mono-ADP-ribosyltransferase PARP14-like isoform X4 [Colossoma macropomum]|uniref:protein mono-ADP-ribosyltransferase PARP14-like isoform X4 n=1 Tax=Colossoma macropomum TaxID=42526 RepID=UPI0018649C7B|nr:protein mono-ADP-ribosyltransferase PARP14-like isoform X4 [Colossoma macropomum]